MTYRPNTETENKVRENNFSLVELILSLKIARMATITLLAFFALGEYALILHFWLPVEIAKNILFYKVVYKIYVMAYLPQ